MAVIVEHIDDAILGVKEEVALERRAVAQVTSTSAMSFCLITLEEYIAIAGLHRFCFFCLKGFRRRPRR